MINRNHRHRVRPALAIVLVVLLSLVTAIRVHDAASGPALQPVSGPARTPASAGSHHQAAAHTGDTVAHHEGGDSHDGAGQDAGPRQAAAWFVQQRAYPRSAIPVGARQNALRQLAALRRAQSRSPSPALAPGLALTNTWQHVGPPSQQTKGPNNLTTDYGTVGGRVTALAIDPAMTSTVYAGTAGGGVWKSLNGGTSWTALTDQQPSLAIGALAIAPTSPYTVYALTGEGNQSIDSYYGAGLLESADGGQTWTQTGAGLGKLSATRLVVDPLTPTILYAALGPNVMAQGQNTLSGGIYRSTDGGATWTLSLDPSSQISGTCTTAPAMVPGSDLAVSVISNTTTVYAALGGPYPCSANGVYKSSNNGQTWTRVFGPGATFGRIALATAPSNPHIVYAAVAIADPGMFDDGRLSGVYESTNDGATWRPLASTGGPVAGSDSQYWYDLCLAVDPQNQQMVYVGGIDVWKGVAATPVTPTVPATWTNVTNSYNGGSVHPDQHAFAFAPDGTMYAGNDGGVYWTQNRGATWTDASAGLDAIQLYGAAVSAPSQGTLFYQGSQDNDLARWNGTGSWTSVIGGDGALSAVDPTNANNAYGGLTSGWLYRTSDGGNSWLQVTGLGLGHDPTGDYGHVNWITPLAMDQTRPQRILMGTYRLWESTNGGTNWAVPGSGKNLTDEPITSTSDSISALAIAPTMTGTVYAGTTNGHVQVTTNDGGSWTDGTGLPNRYVTSIAVSPTAPNVAWAAFSGFNEATPSTPGHIFQTTNGITWTDVSGNLPNIPVNALAVDPANGALYAGTDIGVFVSLDGGATWRTLGTGLPNAAVFGLILRSDGVLYAATHGRGLWSLAVDSNNPTPSPSATDTAVATSTSTPSATATSTPGATNTAVATSTDTATPTNTSTANPTSTATGTTAPTGTATSSPTSTATIIVTPTNTATSVAATATPTATDTAAATATRTPAPTATSTRMPTSTATNTATPTSTNTASPTPTTTATPRPTATNSAVAVSTDTPIPPAATSTPTTMAAPLPISTNTTAPTPSHTLLPTATATRSMASTSPRPTTITAAPPHATRGTRRTRTARLPLTISLSRQSVMAGGTLTIRIRTAPRARVTISLQVPGQKVSVVGSGKHRKRVTRTIVVYGITWPGTANGRGQLNLTRRITYKTARSVQARLTVAVQAKGGTATRDVALTILPRPQRPHARSRGHGRH